MDDKKLWEIAQEQAIKEYEEEYGECWYDVDKYEREDIVFSIYMKIKSTTQN